MQKYELFTVVIESGGDKVSAAMEVALYIDRYCNRLEARKFAYVRDYGLEVTIRNDHGEERLTQHGTWNKRWRRCG